MAVPAWLVTHAPPVVTRPHAKVKLPRPRVVPAAEVPAVEPVDYVALAPEDARAFNENVPFAAGPNPAARPFRLEATGEDRARAIDCLAAAQLYEAGDDTTGERAVAQVVLNRLRHPAFPKTVCGVVFQGSERSTGCQFTFTCDGALAAHGWPDAAWKRARQVAEAMLGGQVYKAVGYATHYHTDWVVPYWSSSLDKIAAVGSHLFFRWTGWWGTPPAFRRTVSTSEPVIAALARYSDAHRTGAALAATQGALAEAAVLGSDAPKPQPDDENSFVVTLNARAGADSFAALARKLCGARTYCKVLGWTDKAKTPAFLPLKPEQIASMGFSYLRDKDRLLEKSLWNCRQFPRANLLECMKQQVFVPASEPPLRDPLQGVQLVPNSGPPPLDGVRRKGEPTPTATASPTPAARVS